MDIVILLRHTPQIVLKSVDREEKVLVMIKRVEFNRIVLKSLIVLRTIPAVQIRPDLQETLPFAAAVYVVKAIIVVFVKFLNKWMTGHIIFFPAVKEPPVAKSLEVFRDERPVNEFFDLQPENLIIFNGFYLLRHEIFYPKGHIS